MAKLLKRIAQKANPLDENNIKQQIRFLLDKYNKAAEEKRIGKYKEEETKKDFILPLFRALGWNVEDSSEVTAEEKISKDRVDYGFRINGIPKFYLEAKALKEDLDNPKFIEQAINYAWHKGCTWAVLTDFESIKIFNAEWQTSSPMQSHLKTITHQEYIDRFQELWLLSKASFEQGLIDKEAEKWGKKTKKTPIDKQILADFTRFRELLSKNISKLNQQKKVTEEELDESIQRILDRLIFIRNCEDRELEAKRLIPCLREWESQGKGHLIDRLRNVFTYFDNEYNSKIFANHLCDDLDVDNDVLKEIIEGLYFTKDQSISYDFSAIEADVLGNIYEQYLGHILKKSEKRAKLTESHTHRKEQGIYYTPTYIVDYIVRNTLGELLKNKNINYEKIRVLDPACGSGSFLIKAFDVINEHYTKHDKNYSQTELDFKTGGAFTTKVKILKNNIFGVDLDKQAVEIAQMNLLLKIAEKGHRLPLLQQNIKCGNSLIADSEISGDKAFKWEDEYKQIMQEGGFDAVVGNPPYVRQEELSAIKPYLQQHYQVYNGMADLFVYFIEQGMNKLKEGGYFGIIVSNKWLRAGYGVNLRKFISKFWVEKFIDFGDLKVFPDATIYPCIIILKKINKSNPKIQVCKMETLSFDSLEGYIKKHRFPVNQKELGEKEWNVQSTKANQLLRKILSSGTGLEKYSGGKICYGIKTGLNEAFVIDDKIRSELVAQDKKNAEIIKPYLTGAEIKRYEIKSKKKYIILTKIGVEINRYPTIKKHLSRFQAELEKRCDKGDHWYELRACAYYNLFDKPKIVWGNLATRASFAFDYSGFYVNAPGCILPTNSKYILGILNSKLISYFLLSICAERQGGFIEQKPVYVSKIPIKDIPESRQQPLIKLVDKMLSLNKRLNIIGDKKTDERERIESEIKKTDTAIDQLVYKLYGITEPEQNIIDKSIK